MKKYRIVTFAGVFETDSKTRYEEMSKILNNAAKENISFKIQRVIGTDSDGREWELRN